MIRNHVTCTRVERYFCACIVNDHKNPCRPALRVLTARAAPVRSRRRAGRGATREPRHRTRAHGSRHPGGVVGAKICQAVFGIRRLRMVSVMNSDQWGFAPGEHHQHILIINRSPLTNCLRRVNADERTRTSMHYMRRTTCRTCAAVRTMVIHETRARRSDGLRHGGMAPSDRLDLCRAAAVSGEESATGGAIWRSAPGDPLR